MAIKNNDITLYEDTARPTIALTCTDDDGNAIDLSGVTDKRFIVFNRHYTVLFDVETAGIAISGASNNIATVTYLKANTATPGAYSYELRAVDSGTERVAARGRLVIKAGQESS